MTTRTLARGLGWFSVGLGLAEVIATHRLGHLVGIRRRQRLLRLFGLREIAAGVGLVSQERLAPWLWARVAGDALDLAALGWFLAAHPRRRTRLGIVTGAVAGVTALDVLAGQRLSRRARAA